jgi:hypothetical protein
MVNELIESGLEGEALFEEVKRLTGLPDSDVAALIAVETGQAAGDTVPPDK